MTTSRSHYAKELAEQLRINGVAEPRVREIVAEVQAHVAETREDPVAAFGQPVDYAAQWLRLSPRRWVSRVVLGAVTALGIVCGVRALFADQPWGGGVALRSGDLVQFGIMLGVMGVLPWTVGLFESRRRASRLGDSSAPVSWPLRLGAAGVFALAMIVVAWVVEERARAAVLVEVPRWSLMAVAVVGISMGFLSGPTPNSAGHAPDAPGSRATSWRVKARRWLS